MKFIEPKWQDLYDTLTGNKRLENVLLDNEALITVYDFYDNYGLKSKEDKKAYVEKANKRTYENLTNVLLNNLETIKKESVRFLISQEFLFSEIREALGFYDDIVLPKSLFQEIFYTCKYCYTESFFQNNWEDFVPLFDFEKISENKQLSAFMDSLMKEFDKLDNIINHSKDFKSYKDIPFQYINYLSQLLGVEQKTFYIEEDMEEQYRVLAENILDIYSVRGTYSSWELMFNFLGFTVEFQEFYFDRRKLYTTENNNYELDESDNEVYKYYLTTIDPRDNKLDGIATGETVMQSDMTEPFEIMDFNDLVKQYGLMCVLGYDDCYEYTNSRYKTETKIYDGPVYKYFKTNYIRVKPKRKFSIGNFSINQLYQLTALLNFLTPEFLKREMYIAVDIGKSEEKLIMNNFPDAGVFSTDFHMFDSEEAPIPNNQETSRYFADKYITNFLDYSNSSNYTTEPRKINDLGVESTYRNSLGVSSYTYTNENNIVKNANVFLNPISEKIKYINTTKYWGSGIKIDNQTGKIFPVWRTNRNYTTSRGKMYISKEQYTQKLYLPNDYKKLTDNEQRIWNNTQQVDLNGYNGNTLRKQIKECNNFTKIKWSTDLPIDVFLNEELTNLDIASALKGKKITQSELDKLLLENYDFKRKYDKEINTRSSFFEKKWINVPNYSWVKIKEFIVNVEYNQLDAFYLFVSSHDNIINYDYINDKIILNFDINNMFINNNGEFEITRNNFDAKREKNAKAFIKLMNSQITNGCYAISFNGNDKYEIYKYTYERTAGTGDTQVPLNRYRLSPDERIQSIDYTINSYNETANQGKDTVLSNEYVKPYGFYEDITDGNIDLYFYFKKTQTTVKLDKITSCGFFISKDNMSYKPLLQTTSYKSVIHKSFLTTNSRITNFSGNNIDNQSIKNANKLGSFYFNNCYVNDDTNIENATYTELKEARDPKFYQYKYCNIKKGDLIYSANDGKLYNFLQNGACSFKDELYKTNFTTTRNNLIENGRIQVRIVNSSSIDTDSYVFGVGEINFFGRLEKVNDDYVIYEYDERYKGGLEETEENDYILSNFDRNIEWNNLGILKQKINRPIREETDKLFDEKNENNYEIANNILTEIFNQINNSFVRKDLINFKGNEQ